MVRLVFLVLFISVLSACSSVPVGAPNSSPNDPRNQQSYEVDSNGFFEKGYWQKESVQQDDILRLDEGEHHPAVQVLLTQAEDARQQGNNQQALSYLDRARQIQPRNAAIFYRQAWLNYQLGELQQSQQLLQRAQLFLRRSNTSYDILQRRIKTLQNKVDAQGGY
ncbi:MAG: tetratricopeptide (TPR) repeat protein [Oleispira sp.]